MVRYGGLVGILDPHGIRHGTLYESKEKHIGELRDTYQGFADPPAVHFQG